MLAWSGNQPLVSFPDYPGGYLYFYNTVSGAPISTYMDMAGEHPHQNPVQLDIYGNAEVYLAPDTYTMILCDKDKKVITLYHGIVGGQYNEILVAIQADVQELQDRLDELEELIATASLDASLLEAQLDNKAENDHTHEKGEVGGILTNLGGPALGEFHSVQVDYELGAWNANTYYIRMAADAPQPGATPLDPTTSTSSANFSDFFTLVENGFKCIVPCSVLVMVDGREYFAFSYPYPHAHTALYLNGEFLTSPHTGYLRDYYMDGFQMHLGNYYAFSNTGAIALKLEVDDVLELRARVGGGIQHNLLGVGNVTTKRLITGMSIMIIPAAQLPENA